MNPTAITLDAIVDDLPPTGSILNEDAKLNELATRQKLYDLEGKNVYIELFNGDVSVGRLYDVDCSVYNTFRIGTAALNRHFIDTVKYIREV